MKRTKSMKVNETIESRELLLYCENDRSIYFNGIVPTVKKLSKKYAKGIYDREKAIDLFYYVADFAAKRYCQEYAYAKSFGYVFDVTARFTCAAMLEEDYFENIQKADI